MKQILTVAVVASALLLGARAHAQDDTTTPEVYAPAYFQQFAPQTAADMVARIPGFEIQGGEGSERGFGQASLNILINGRRPSSKSSGANDILSRIPADTVVQIEIVDGASLDIPGLSGQVANIIAKSGDLSGSWNWAARFEEGTEPQLFDGGINVSGKRGNLEFVGSLGFGHFTFTEDGEEQFFNGDGSLAQDRAEQVFYDTEAPSADLNLTLNRDNGDVANLNLYGRVRNVSNGVFEDFTRPPTTELSGQSFVFGGEDEKEYEIGGDYATDLNLFGQNGRFKLIALNRYEDSRSPNLFVVNDFTTGRFEQRFDRKDIEHEYIGRAEYTFKTGGTRDWTASLEGALNQLDSDTILRQNDNTPILDTVDVEERRLLAAITQSWAASPKLNLQASLGAEYSEIDVVSEDAPAREFFRPKGFLSGSYKLSDIYTLRAKAERSVGQLNFGIFVSTVNLVDNNANEGNNLIKPEQSWEGEIELRRQIETGLSGAVKIFGEIRQDPIDFIPFEDGTGGFGNLDTDAYIYGINASGTWVGDSAGLKGLRISAEGQLQDSKLDDPLTNITRDLNDLTRWFFDVETRYDIPNTPFAVFGEVEWSDAAPAFRLDEIRTNNFRQPETEIGIVHKDLLGMQWTLKLQNLLDYEFTRERQIFNGDRFGDLRRREFLTRQRGRRLSIELTDTF